MSEHMESYSKKTRSGNDYKKLMVMFAAWLLMAATLIWPETSAVAVRKAMEQWYYGVAPAIFPFILLLPLITCRESTYIYEKVFGRLAGILFGLPGSAAPAIVIGMAAGSPAGVIAAGQVAENAGLKQQQLLRIAGCMCGLSPAFLISGIGANIMNDPEFGRKLFLSQLITQIVMLAATRRVNGGCVVEKEDVKTEVQGVVAAVISVLTVAGYMVIFSVLAGIIGKVWKESSSVIVICILEVAMGVEKIASIELEASTKMIGMAGLCGFGGICIFSQNTKILKKYGIKAVEYLPYKLISSISSAGIMAVQTIAKIEIRHQIPQEYIYITSLIGIILVIPACIGQKRHIS